MKNRRRAPGNECCLAAAAERGVVWRHRASILVRMRAGSASRRDEPAVILPGGGGGIAGSGRRGVCEKWAPSANQLSVAAIVRGVRRGYGDRILRNGEGLLPTLRCRSSPVFCRFFRSANFLRMDPSRLAPFVRSVRSLLPSVLSLWRLPRLVFVP